MTVVLTRNCLSCETFKVTVIWSTLSATGGIAVMIEAMVSMPDASSCESSTSTSGPPSVLLVNVSE